MRYSETGYNLKLIYPQYVEKVKPTLVNRTASGRTGDCGKDSLDRVPPEVEPFLTIIAILAAAF